MRQYEFIWRKLKQDNKVTVRTPKENFFTLVNMVKKEKYKDVGFKLQCSEKDCMYKMKITRDFIAEEITFEMIKYNTISLFGLKG